MRLFFNKRRGRRFPFDGNDFPNPDGAVDLAGLQGLSDFAVEDVENMLRTDAAECGDTVLDFGFLEQDAVHAVLTIFAPSAPNDFSTAT